MRRDRFLIAALSLASFAVIYSSNVIAPLVTQIAADFDTTVGTIGVVAAAYALPGIVVGALAGPFSDRYGRRPFMVGGLGILGVGTIASALAPELWQVAALRCVAGFGASVVLPNMMSAAADRFTGGGRARVIATIFLANTLGGLVGVTASGIVAEHYGWRVALTAAGVVALVGAGATALAPIERIVPSMTPFIAQLRRVLGDRSAVALLVSNTFGAMALQTWALYMVVFFERQFGLARDVASTYALAQGAGLVLGTQLGPNIVARTGPRVALALSLVGYGLVVLVVTGVPLALPLAVGLIVAAATLYGFRATSNAVLMTEQMPSARSTVLGLSATTVAAANALSATAGGIALDTVGFIAIGALCLVAAAISAAVVMAVVKEFDGAGAAESGTGPVLPTT